MRDGCLTALRPKATVRGIFCRGPGIPVRKGGYPSAKKPFAPAVSAALRGAYSSFPRLYHTLFSWPHYSALFPPVNKLGKKEKSLVVLLSTVRKRKGKFVRKNGKNGKSRHPNRLGCLIFSFSFPEENREGSRSYPFSMSPRISSTALSASSLQIRLSQKAERARSFSACSRRTESSKRLREIASYRACSTAAEGST